MVTASPYVSARNKQTDRLASMRATLLSLMMLTAVLLSGAGIYAATASSAYHASDGYGITAFSR